jgi:adenylate cyclase
MPTEHSPEVKFDIGHVLFIDIVGYSRLLITGQSEQLEKLRTIVRGTDQFRVAEAEGKLLRLPTGDGGALVFRTNSEAPVLCAIEIAKALKAHPEVRVRMGIHSGPVNEVTDLNEQANIAGAGINFAQRVMDYGDAGHILLSQHVADDLEQYPRWQPYLHDLGDVEIKHGVRLGIVSFSGPEAGNPQLPTKLNAAKQRQRRRRWTFAAALLLISAGVIAAGFLFYLGRGRPFAVAPDKSIAVLPFENLSSEKENAYFANGIQDEILARLSQISQLKVISRTSTQKFQSAPPNLREIAQQLGVANILEGSVQKAADAVRVNVQLINAATDVHLWSEIYDRKLTDVFSVESDVAIRIAQALAAKLSGAEATAVSVKPTENPAAHQLYLNGLYFWRKGKSADDARKAVDYFNKAIAVDPNYGEAYAALSENYFDLVYFGAGGTQECYPKAEAAARKALAIDPNIAEAHIALARVKGPSDFALAVSEAKRALQLDPNSASAHAYHGAQLSCLTRYDEASEEFKRALELDPLNLGLRTDIAFISVAAGHYDEAIDELRQILAMDDTLYREHAILGSALEQKGLFDEALAEYKRAQAIEYDPGLLCSFATAYARSGNRAAAEETLKQMYEIAKTKSIDAQDFATVYLVLGDKEEALRWLEKGYERHENLIGIRRDPDYAPLRSDPRFEALANKIVPRSLMK